MKLTFTVILLAAVGFAGCAKKDEEPSPGTFKFVYTKTLVSCKECHVPGGAPSNTGVQFDVSTQDSAYATLTTKNSSGLASSGCHSVRLVNPGNPQASYLAGVLIASYGTANFAGVSGCTPYNVHYQDQHLSSAEIESLVTWIQQGAQNN